MVARMRLPFQLVNYIFVGDRVAEVARMFRIHAKGLIGGEIPMMDFDYPLTEHLECTGCAFGKKKKLLPHAFKRLQSKMVVLENAPEKTPNPADLREWLEEQGIPTATIDFTKGAVSVIEQMGALFDLQKSAAEIVKKYTEGLAKTKKLKKRKKNVVVLLGISSPHHDEGHVLLEVPGCAADKTILAPLGLSNVGKPLMNDEPVYLDGVQLLKSIKGLQKAAPDIIVLTGDPRPGQLALAQAVKKTPALVQKVPALAKQQVFALPHYCEALVFRLPDTLRKWDHCLSACD